MEFKHLIASFVAVGLAGCGNSQTAESDGNLQDTPDSEETQVADGWTFSEDVDPFNDRSIATMSTDLVDDTAQLAVTIACGSGKHLAYEFGAYDLDGDPLKLSRFPNSVEREFFSFNELIRYKVRVDQQKADDHFYFNPERSNVFIIRPGNRMQPFGMKSDDLRAGSKITIGLKFRNGEAVFYLDQTTPRIRSFIDECRSPSSSAAIEAPDNESSSEQPQLSEGVLPRNEIGNAAIAPDESALSQPSTSTSSNSEPIAISKAKSARPIQPLQRMIEQSDFPSRERGTGSWEVAFDLQITSGGFIRDCAITQSSGSKAIDEETCRLVTRRARFTPALDAEGSPIDSKYAAKVVWERS